jgi:hypothetical protein
MHYSQREEFDPDLQFTTLLSLLLLLLLLLLPADFAPICCC